MPVHDVRWMIERRWRRIHSGDWAPFPEDPDSKSSPVEAIVILKEPSRHSGFECQQWISSMQYKKKYGRTKEKEGTPSASTIYPLRQIHRFWETAGFISKPVFRTPGQPLKKMGTYTISILERYDNCEMHPPLIPANLRCGEKRSKRLQEMTNQTKVTDSLRVKKIIRIPLCLWKLSSWKWNTPPTVWNHTLHYHCTKLVSAAPIISKTSWCHYCIARM